MLRRSSILVLVLVLIATPIASTAMAQDTIKLSYLVDDSQANSGMATALAEAYMAQHPNVEINVELRPGGTKVTILSKHVWQPAI